MNPQESGGGGSGACGGSGFSSVGGGGILPAIAYSGPYTHMPCPTTIGKENKDEASSTAGDKSN